MAREPLLRVARLSCDLSEAISEFSSLIWRFCSLTS